MADKMKLLILISSLAAVQASVVKPKCDGPVFNKVRNRVEILKANLDKPYLLTTDYSTNNLYFSYDDHIPNLTFKTAKFNLSTKDHEEIDGIEDAYGSCVDADTNDMYIGSSNGIYKLNKGTNKGEYHGAKGYNVWSIFCKNNIVYFVEFTSEFVYKLKDGNVSTFEELKGVKADKFVYDNDDTMFFTTYSGLRSQKFGTEDAVFYDGPDRLNIRGLTTDKHGAVYAAAENGIYVANKEDHVLEKVLDGIDAFGVAFDIENNLIYANRTTVMRLLPCDRVL